MKYRSLAPCVAALALSFSVILSGCSHSADEVTPPLLTVEVCKPDLKTVPDYDYFTGRVVAVSAVEIKSQVSGELKAITFRDGAYVKGPEELRETVVSNWALQVSPLGPAPLLSASALYPGRGEWDVLFAIDVRPYQAKFDAVQAQLASAKAQFKLARSEYELEKTLVSKKASDQEKVNVKAADELVKAAEVDKAIAALENAQLELDYTQVRAPFSGRATKKTDVSVGMIVTAGKDVLGSLVSVDPIFVDFILDERMQLRFLDEVIKSKGRATPENIQAEKIPVDLALSDDLGFRVKGTIVRVENQINKDTGTIGVRAQFDNPDRRLTPGLFAKVRAPIGDPHAVLLVSERAVGTDQGLKYVYIVTDQGVVERRNVTLGSLVDGQRVVQHGLSKDDWVIVNGMSRVRPESKVKVKELKEMPGQPAPAVVMAPAVAPKNTEK